MKWLAAAAVALTADLLYLQIAAPPAPLATRISDVTQLVMAAIAAAACARAARRATAGAARAFWANLALFAGVWAAGQLVWTLASTTGPPVRILAPWDMLFLLATVPAISAILCRPDRWTNVRAGLFVDAALLAVAAFHVYAFFGVGHWFAGDQSGHAEWIGRVHAAKGMLVVGAGLWATSTAVSGRRFYAHVTAALALFHLGAIVSNAVMRQGGYRPGLYDIPWTVPFLYIAWLTSTEDFPRALAGATPGADWRETRVGAVLSVGLVLIAPLVHLGVVGIFGATPEITRLRIPLTLATTLVVAVLTVLRQLGHLRIVEEQIARRAAERDAAEGARRRLEERYGGLVQSVNAVVWRADPATLRFTFVSDQAQALLGFPVEAWTREPDFWERHLHPEDREKAVALCRNAMAEGRSHEFRYRMITASGETVWINDNVRVIADPGGGTEAFGVMVDVTAQKRLEDEYRQSQKMEAVGLLAGGIAHDFNNLLGVIIGYAELALKSLDPTHQARARVEEIRKAADRAAGLTRQLLAFSRRQVVQPRLLHLAEVVHGLEPMLRRILGEDVQLVTRAEGEDTVVSADPGQLEQVIMNLAVNARDAMPRGGRLTLHTAGARLDEEFARAHPGSRPGAYAMLEVSDQGSGMDDATRARIFEPFFTTKELGRGTGLGLSTVYGIVKQNEGYISVDSTEGEGSTFRVYLPLADGAPLRDATITPAVSTGREAGGSETILLVEDEDGLRAIAGEILEGAGYRVLEARSVEEARRVALQPGRIDAILSDVILPGASGPQGVAYVRALHPRVKVLYMSGYSDVEERHGVLESGDRLIEKPFPAATLLSAVREVLDG